MSGNSKTSIETATSVFTDFVNVISGARQTATQEFAQFWEVLGQPQQREIAIPRRKKRGSANGVIYGRVVPDMCRRRVVKDAEIQTEMLGIRYPLKRRYDDDSEKESQPSKSVRRDNNMAEPSHQNKKLKMKEVFIPQTPVLSFQSRIEPASISSPSSSSYTSYDSQESGYVRRKINEYETSHSPVGATFSHTATNTPFYTVPPIITVSPHLRRKYLKPNERHKAKMKELIQLIPYFKLRRADTITGPDGVQRPNPYWIEIYNPKKTSLYYYC